MVASMAIMNIAAITETSTSGRRVLTSIMGISLEEPVAPGGAQTRERGGGSYIESEAGGEGAGEGISGAGLQKGVIGRGCGANIRTDDRLSTISSISSISSMWSATFYAKDLAMQRKRLDPVIPTGQDALRAQELHGALEGRDTINAPLRLQVDDSTVLDLPPMVARLLMNILEETAAGHAVALIPVEAEVTTQQAAELLNVSRPFVVGLIEKGLLPSRMVGNQRRLPLKAVLAYKADNRARRHKMLDEMAAIDQEFGLHMSDDERPLAFLDASALYPALLRNILIRLAIDDLYQAFWSQRVHDEWTNAIFRDRPHLPRAPIERTRRLVEKSIDDAMVSGYEPLIETLTLPDRDDRHVLAAAIHCDARVIVTANLRDFPNATLALHDIEARHPELLHPETFDGLSGRGARDNAAASSGPPQAADDGGRGSECHGAVGSCSKRGGARPFF